MKFSAVEFSKYECGVIDKHDLYPRSRIYSTSECAVLNLNTGYWDPVACSSTTNQFICEMKTDLELETPQKVYIVVDLIKPTRVKSGDQIAFDEVVMDPTGSWDKLRHRFVSPWVGTFKFCKINFKTSDAQTRHIQGRIDDSHSDTFDLQDDNESGNMHCRQHIKHKIDKKGDFVAFYRALDSITLDCSKSTPCRLLIQS